MSEFKFNFGSSENEGVAGEWVVENTESSDSGPEAREVLWVPATNFPAHWNTTVVKRTFGEHVLQTVSSAEVEDYLIKQESKKSEVVTAISESSDLVAGQYEGGLKVWECSQDLCHYLVDHDTPLQGSRVLDLGCGAGLPGMLAFKLGATSVHFQDFNSEVLETYTMRNLELNSIDHSTCAFFAGDWASFASLADSRNHRYDLILTAETIYSVKSYPKLLKVFSLLLADSGIVEKESLSLCSLVAAKNDYFGVGGGVATFTNFVQSSKKFEIETAHHLQANLPRKILKLTRINCSQENS